MLVVLVTNFLDAILYWRWWYWTRN